MGKAFSCDRCGKLFVPDEELKSIYEGIHYNVALYNEPPKMDGPAYVNRDGRTVDLCYDCLNTLNKWMNSFASDFLVAVLDEPVKKPRKKKGEK